MADPADLVVRDATVRGRPGRWRVEVRDGLVAAIEPEGPGVAAAPIALDAAGGLVTESFVDAHLHLCKVYTLDRVGDAALSAYTGGSMGAAMTAIELASVVKDQYSEDWIYPNARRALLDGVRHGVLHVQAFADVDTRAKLEGVKPLLRLRDELRDVVDVRVVAFPQDGLLRDEGAADFVRAAVERGADVVGGIPWIEHSDDEAREHVDRMCALAAAAGRRVAMLVDDAGDPSLRTTEMLAAAMLRHGLAGRGVACHARAMGVWPEPYFRRLVGLVRRAGLTFVTDPHTGPVRLRAMELLDAGVPVALGQDDIEDAYYPFGRHNLLEVAFVAAHVLGAIDGPALERVFDMVTTGAAAVLGLAGHRLAPGAAANLVVLDGADVREALTRHAAPRYVVSRGRLVAETETTTRWGEGLSS